MIYAKTLADVYTTKGDRLLICEGRVHRPILPEVNTHRSHSKSSASSRAIPTEKQISKLLEDPALPLVWASEQPGMQGGTELTGQDLQDAKDLFARLRGFTLEQIQDYLDAHPDKSTRLHKSWLSRPMEWFMWHTMIIGATEDGWANFFKQRSTKHTLLAMPEFGEFAAQLEDEWMTSTPSFLPDGEWVTPYVRKDETFDEFSDPLRTKLEISSARCARVSYLNHAGVRDLQSDISLFHDKLAAADPKHAAPMEFPCTPLTGAMKPMGNFHGFRQFRHIVEGLVPA